MVSEPVASEAPPATSDLVTAPGQTRDGPANRPVVPAGPNKRIFLDNLLN
jgi:hypothetical protein